LSLSLEIFINNDNKFISSFTKLCTMKNLHFKTVLFVLILVLAGTQINAQKESDKLKTEIKALNDKLVKAALEDDMETTANFYTDNLIQMPNYSPMIRGKKMMMEKSAEEKKAGYKMLSMNLNPDEVYPDKQYVIEIGHYVIKMQIPNMTEPVSDNGKYVTIWERQKDGSLKIFIDTWNTDVNPMEMHEKMEKDKMK
jgi:ketosteroid isomerase-like protein